MHFSLMVWSSIYELSALDAYNLLYRVLLSMRAVPREMIFCSSVVLMLLGILLLVFCKLNSLLLKPKSSNNLRSSCCFHFPYFLDFLQDLYIASRAFLLFSKKYCIPFFRKRPMSQVCSLHRSLCWFGLACPRV